MGRRWAPRGFGYDTATAMADLGRPLTALSAQEAGKRWSCWDLPDVAAVVHDPDGGWVEATAAVQAIARVAQASGAMIHCGAAVTAVDGDDAQAALVVDGARRRFGRVVVAAGPWVARLTPVAAQVSRQQVAWVRVPSDERLRQMPVWLHDMADSGRHGSPQGDDHVLKMGLHRRSEQVDPDVSRDVDGEFLDETKPRVAAFFKVAPRSVEGRVCLYTNSPSGDLRVAPLPHASAVVVAGLGSGHALRFGPVLGERVADAVEGRPGWDRLGCEDGGAEVW